MLGVDAFRRRWGATKFFLYSGKIFGQNVPLPRKRQNPPRGNMGRPLGPWILRPIAPHGDCLKVYNVGLLGFGFIGKVHAYGYVNLPLFYFF